MSKVHNKHHGTAPADAVYIGRGSPWGNPFVIGVDGDRDAVCDRFERVTLPHLDLAPLIGKDLVCFCAPKRCHGDSILRAIVARSALGEQPEVKE
jgi:hypothetical protein